MARFLAALSIFQTRHSTSEPHAESEDVNHVTQNGNQVAHLHAMDGGTISALEAERIEIRAASLALHPATSMGLCNVPRRSQ